MSINTRKFLLGFILSLMLLPIMAFSSTEFKGTETVNINKADASTLSAYLKGVGPNKAEAIVKFRKENGNFKSLTDLKNVPGIGDETYKGVKSKISMSRGKSSAPEGYKLGKTSGNSTSTKKKSTTKKTTAKKSATEKSTANKSKTAKAKAVKETTTKKASTAKKSAASKSKTAKAKAVKKATTKKASTTKKKPSTTKKKAEKEKIKKTAS